MGHAKEGNLDDLNVDEDPSIVETPDWWRLIDHLKVKAFVEITVARTIREGIQQVRINRVKKINNKIIQDAKLPDVFIGFPLYFSACQNFRNRSYEAKHHHHGIS